MINSVVRSALIIKTMEKLTKEEYEAEFKKYLDEGINWGANKNAVIQTSYKNESAKSDVEQFAYDSFWSGATFIMRKYGIELAKGFDCGIPEPYEEFKPMNKLPRQAKGEDFSIPVLVFDEADTDFCEIGHYNFDTQSWSHFGENSMKLICWCYLPNPKEFLKSKNWTSVEHDGYRY